VPLGRFWLPVGQRFRRQRMAFFTNEMGDDCKLKIK
jgi:hypothetical protein